MSHFTLWRILPGADPLGGQQALASGHQGALLYSDPPVCAGRLPCALVRFRIGTMLLALLSSALLTSSLAAPTLAALKDLSPEAVGNIVLSGRDHSIVESVASPAVRGLDPPGQVKLQLTERASHRYGGCVRRRWTATFLQTPGSPESSAALHDAWPNTEVALLSNSPCSSGEFVHVNPRLTIEAALRALGHLSDVRSGKAKVRFTCADSTRSKLCRTPEMIRRQLARLPAWAVTMEDGATELWLGEPGQVVTSVSFDQARPLQVKVERAMPAPF